MTADAAPLVEVEDLVVAFAPAGGGPSLTAVDRVSLSIAPGEVVGLVGESGSGKTTLAKSVLRLYRPTAGRILFAGRDITELSDRALRPTRPSLQMVFQDPLSSFNPRVPVGDAVGLALRLRRRRPRIEIAKSVDELLRQVGLGPQFARRFPHEMSGGQLQRVAIARAVAMEPKLIVADEAVSKLDVSVRAQILNLLKDVRERTGVALLFITHDLRVARYISHRIGVMFFGRLVEVGPTEALFAAPRHPYTAALLSTLSESGAEAVALEPPAPAESGGCRYRTRCPRATPECAERRPELAPGDPHPVACFHPLSG